jgi:hypothetical protein
MKNFGVDDAQNDILMNPECAEFSLYYLIKENPDFQETALPLTSQPVTTDAKANVEPDIAGKDRHCSPLAVYESSTSLAFAEPISPLLSTCSSNEPMMNIKSKRSQLNPLARLRRANSVEDSRSIRSLDSDQNQSVKSPKSSTEAYAAPKNYNHEEITHIAPPHTRKAKSQAAITFADAPKPSTDKGYMERIISGASDSDTTKSAGYSLVNTPQCSVTDKAGLRSSRTSAGAQSSTKLNLRKFLAGFYKIFGIKTLASKTYTKKESVVTVVLPTTQTKTNEEKSKQNLNLIPTKWRNSWLKRNSVGVI